MYKPCNEWRCKCDDWFDRKKDFREDYEDNRWNDKDDYRKDYRKEGDCDNFSQEKYRKDCRKNDDWDDYDKDDRKYGSDGYRKECWECRRVHCCPLFYK